jgi:thiamine-monophosphate kinase
MAALDEFALIRRFFTPSSYPAHVIAGVGDDCALLAVPAASEFAISVDTQVAGVHFHADAAPALIASRVLRCAASDLAAIGAIPLGFTLALTLPKMDESWLSAFARSLAETADILQCPLIGGDTTRGPLCITVQVHGAVPAGQALRRSGAQAGDDVWVSGTLGDGAAALALLEKRLLLNNNDSIFKETETYLLQRFYQPMVDIALGVQLRGLASACIDVSDGLLADLAHIALASNVAAHIFQSTLPISLLWRDAVTQEQAQQWALTGGDDYRLCFTAPAFRRNTLAALGQLVRVGAVVPMCDMFTNGRVVVLDENGVTCSVSSGGFQHF